jgi:hypothetical protein
VLAAPTIARSTPGLVSQDRFQFGASKKEGHNIAAKGAAFRNKSTVRWWSKAVTFISLLARAAFPRAY